MQNAGVAKLPVPSKPADAKAADTRKAREIFLDPLPVPDATESNTDTAWSLWEHTLQSHQEPDAPTESAPLEDFADTVQVGLPPLPKKP